MKKLILWLRKCLGKRKFIINLCDKFGGHEAGPDWGYCGSGMMDHWCKWCDGIFQVPVLENDVSDFKSELMGLVGSGVMPPEQGETL